MMFAPGFHLFWFFGMGLVVLVVIVVVIAIARSASGPAQQTFPPSPPPMPPGSPAATEAPLDILARRFAKGEITADEYQKARDLLKQ